MPGQRSNARQVASLGETPAEARRRMQSTGGGEATAETRPPLGEEVEGPLTPQHMSAIREAEEGFSGAGQDGTVEEGVELSEPPSPEKAMTMIRQLGQDKLQLQTELDAALQLVGRYRNKYGDLD